MPQLTNATIDSQRDAAFRFRGQEIGYVETSADAIDPETGDITESNVTTPIGDEADDDPGALIGMISQKRIDDSGGKYKVGSITVKVRANDLPSGAPRAVDEITWNGKTYLIIDWTHSQGLNVYELNCNLP